MKTFSALSLFLVINNCLSQQLPVTVYAPRNGALFAGANSICQDRQGWMWFTSSYDVVRYDGYEFKVYPLAAGVEVNFYYSIFEAGDEIWVMALPYPLKIVGDSLQRLDVPNLPPLLSNNIELNGHQYFLAEYGLFEYTNQTFRTIIFDSTLAFHEDEHLIRYGDTQIVTYKRNKSLVVFDLIEQRAYTFRMPVYDIAQDHTGKIYLLLQGKGIYTLNEILIHDHRIDTSLHVLLTDPEAQFMEIDGQGNVIVGIQDEYLLRVGPDKSISTFRESDGLPGVWFYDMYQDREGNVWIGLNNGLCKIRNTQWRRYTKEQGLYSNYIFFFLEDGDNMYVGTYNGLNVFSNNQLRQVKEGDQPFMCQSMTLQTHSATALGMTKNQEDHERKIHFLRENKLYSADLNARDLQVRNTTIITELSGTAIYLAQDVAGTLYITTNVGLYSWYQNRLEKDIPGSKHYHNVFIDSHQRLWASAFGDQLEVFVIQDENERPVLRKLPIPDSLDKAFLEIKNGRSITEDRNGNIYVGTRYDGFFHLTFTKDQLSGIRHWTEQDNLNSNTIWGISVDQESDCLIATARGLNRLDVQKGVMTDEGASAQIYTSAMVHASQNGTIWVASHPGIILLNKQPQDGRPFSAFITGISLNALPLDGQNDLSDTDHFSYKENNLNISYSANTFLDENEVQYIYKLSMNDNGEWSRPTDMHSIQYPALQPGSYEFTVKAVDSHGVLSENEAHWTFVIDPPFWQTTWFIGIVVLNLAIGVYLLYRFRIRQLMQLQLMRNNISRNLHDDLGASLSNINILNALTLRNLPDRKKAESYLTQSSEDIQRISESLSDIVWNVNPMNDDLDQVYSHMKRYAADMLEGKNIAAHLDFPPPGSKTHLSMDKRRDFFLIFKEAINNMTKYSRASDARVQLKEESNTLHLVIEDNGIGFDLPNVSSGNGLHNMRQRALNWNAPLEIESKPGKGTRIRLRMRIG